MSNESYQTPDIQKLIAELNIEARPYQIRIVEKVYDCLINKKMRSVLIESPCGSGKTVINLMLAKLLDRLGYRIGWVAMRRFLLKQAKEENTSKGFDVPIKFISMFDKDPPTDIDVVFVDEAQHDVTASMVHTHAKIKAKHIIGTTATNFRADKVKLCFDTVIKDAGIPTLIRDGYLSPYHHFSIPKWSVEDVVKYYTDEPDRWGKSVIYFHRLEHCYQATKLLTDFGIVAETVDGSSDIDRQLEEFKEGKIQVLNNCMKLTEGMNITDIQTVFCKPSCKPVTIQMAGRVLRKCPKHAFKQVVQVENTPYPFQKTAMSELQHIKIDGIWRTFEVNKEIDSIRRRTTRALTKIDAELPSYIKKKMLSGRMNRSSFIDRDRQLGTIDPDRETLREAVDDNRI